MSVCWLTSDSNTRRLLWEFVRIVLQKTVLTSVAGGANSTVIGRSGSFVLFEKPCFC
jgi:hypothetical protein